MLTIVVGVDPGQTAGKRATAMPAGVGDRCPNGNVAATGGDLEFVRAKRQETTTAGSQMDSMRG